MEIVTQSVAHDGNTPTRSRKLRAALAYARGSRPVFPLHSVDDQGRCSCEEPGCDHPGKHPRVKGGFYAATTDASRITAWFNRWPDANIGSPSGEDSDTLAVDHDLYKPEAVSLEEIEAELGPVSEGVTIETGSGGRQYLFKYPKGSGIRNTTGLLRGVDIRGEGGYILLPPSTTQGTYKRLDNRTLTDPPAQLVERLTEPDRGRSGNTRRTAAEPISADLDGPPIFEGERDDTLTSIAGKLHDGTRALTDLQDELLEINDARCIPPLPERQVRKIARSIHKRTPCKPSAPQPDRATLEGLGAVEAEVEGADWRGMGGRSRRSVMVALIKAGRRYATMTPSGPRISISYRTLALASALSRRATENAVKRLKAEGWIRTDNATRRGVKAGAFILLLPVRARVGHSTTRGVREAEEASVLPLRAPYSAPRLRWSQPQYTPRRGVVRGTRKVRQGPPPEPRGTIKRLGKTCEQIVDILEAAGGELALDDLYGHLHPEKSPDDRRRWRPRDLRRRVLSRLETAAVVKCSETGDTVSLSADWLEALNLERARTGEIEAYERDLRHYNEKRKAYRNRRKVKPDRDPTEEEMQERRESYPDRRRQHITVAIARLFEEYPEYRTRRPGQVACALVMFNYLPPDFPRGQGDGLPKDAEVEELLDGVAA